MTSVSSSMAGAAGRYATALFELARQEGKLEAVEASLAEVSAALSESGDFKRLIKSPAFSAGTQSTALTVLFKALKLEPLVENFLLVLAKNRRLAAIDGIIEAFNALAAESRGEAAADVTSATPLTDEQTQALSAALRDKLGKTAKINAKVDPSLLGGLIVKIGSRMVDSSLRTKLNALKYAMKEVG